jgi:hypothetical protein
MRDATSNRAVSSGVFSLSFLNGNERAIPPQTFIHIGSRHGRMSISNRPDGCVPVFVVAVHIPVWLEAPLILKIHYILGTVEGFRDSIVQHSTPVRSKSDG